MLYERTLGQWLEHWAETTPDREYIVYSDRNLRFTWSQFNRRVDDMAKGLIAIGVERGTHVGIWAANVPDWLTLLYACAKIGAVYVTVNTNYKQAELEYLCQNSDMHTLCIVNGEKDSDFVQMTYAMLPELRTCQRGHLRSERFPYMRNVIYVGQEKYRGMYNTAEILLLGDNVDDSRLDEMKAKVTCHDVVNMQYTSGTTGFPKGVMLTHYNIANNGFLTGEHMKFTQDDKLCVCVPLFHCFGVVLATMNCLTHGCTEVMVERFDPLVVLASIHKERCTALYGVPTMFIAELNHPMFDMFDMSSLRTGIMAGSLCPVELMKQVEEKMFMKVTSVYGLTEASPGMTHTRIDDPAEVRYTTVGRDFEHTEVRVIDPETGLECPVGVQGEAGRDVQPRLQHHEGLLQEPRSHGRSDRQRRLPPLRRPGREGRTRQLPHHRPHQGHDYPRRREHLPPRNRGIPLPATRREGRAGGRHPVEEIRRSRRRLHHPPRGRHDGRERGARLLPGQNLALQNTQIHLLRQGIPHDGQRKDTEVQIERCGPATVQGAGNRNNLTGKENPG